MAMRPIDIARKLGISTTTLRKYEELGLIPAVPRSASGYRIYTQEHFAYFICIREMLGAFELSQISGIMKKVLAKETDAALWRVNKAQADLHQEKLISEKIILNLGLLERQEEKYPAEDTAPVLMTINAVSRETGVPATTIRYWDKIGLISSQRGRENNYRMFTPGHIKQILTIYALKFTFQAKGQKHFVNLIREELKEFDLDDKDRLSSMKKDIEKYLNRMNRAQISSITSLYRLCLQVDSGTWNGI